MTLEDPTGREERRVFRVTVERNRLRFAAAHFTTFEGQCEPLHGHNYDVTVEVEGDLTEDAWVIDFRKLKDATRALCEQLDHRFLLQLRSPALQIEELARSWRVGFGDRTWELPREDVAALPIDNTTAERLAEWFANGLAECLRALGATNARSITVGVEEAPGQTGGFRLELGTPS